MVNASFITNNEAILAVQHTHTQSKQIFTEHIVCVCKVMSTHNIVH